MRPFIKTLKALSISVSISLPSVAVADISVKQHGISGVVSHVDREGIIHLEEGVRHSPRIPVRQSYAIRQSALQIDPAALAVIVDGRDISCVFVYEIEDYIVANCRLRFDRDSVADAYFFPSSVTEIARTLNIGELNCSSEDQVALTAQPSLRIPGLTRSDCKKVLHDDL